MVVVRIRPVDISNAPTEKGLENVGYEFESYMLTRARGQKFSKQ
ncbi:hypothetical protein TNCV_2082911 [Trichonephila clavipes]|nr:hypothetical protein TNCV_2082911 [Trichonephila clavipes]